MDRISLSTFALPKLAFPVGSLIAGALNISTKTESEEYQALMKLHDTMEVKFEEISRTIAVATKVIARESNLNEYINQVHVPARNLNQLIALFWNPAVDKSSDLVEAFKQNCYFNPQSQGTPLGILNYIYLNTVNYCHGLSPQQISLLAEFVPLLRQIRMQLSSDWAKEQFDELTPDLNTWFSDLGSTTAKAVLKKIEEGIVNSILKETEIEPQQNSMCLLQDIITGKNYHRKAIEEFEYIIRFDVLKMMVFGSICANITFGGDKPAMNWFQNQLLVTAKAILDNVKSYISTELKIKKPVE
uniref:EcsC family protein n=1 Tax=Globodera pallida TaxID=36090 RepID=A0A183CB06_GLOPA